MPTPIDDETLRGYLADTLDPTEMARVEKALRDSAELRQRLEQVRADRADPTVHSLGSIWRRNRLTCVDRETLGSFLLDVLDPSYAAYIRFHIEVVECPFCRANLADLESKSRPLTEQDQIRRRRIYDSGRGLIGG
jgi:transcriptional regulator NrdR family protein